MTVIRQTQQIVQVLSRTTRDATTVITSINSNTSESVTVSSVTWNNYSGTITLSATVPSGVVVGDIIDDLDGNAYLITALPGGNDLTCQDFDSITEPVTGAASITEAHASVTLWEAALDDTPVYASGDDAVGHLFGTQLDESVTISGGTTVGLNSITLTSPDSERHDGTPGSGAGINTSVTFVAINIAALNVIMSWLDLENSKSNGNRCIQVSSAVADNMILQNSILLSTATSGTNPIVDLSTGGAINGSVLNTMLIGGYAEGFRGKVGETGWVLSNVAVHDCGRDGLSPGIESLSGQTIKNTIVTDSGGSDFSGTVAASATNLSSDGTAPSGTGDDPTTSANNYVSNSSPYDLHLVDINADAFETGTDLGTTDDVNVDVDGYDRDVGATTWSIGPHDGNNLRGANIIPLIYRHLVQQGIS